MLDRLVNFFSEPSYLVALAFGVLALGYAISRPEMFIYIAAGFAVLVSITPPTLFDPLEYIPLWGPLEGIRSYNRFFAVIGGAALLVAMTAAGFRLVGGLYPSAKLLLFTHMLILAKNLIYTDDYTFVVVVFVGFVIVAVVFSILFQAANTPTEAFSLYLLFILATAAIFFSANLFQFYVNRSAMFVVGGRFHGITNNPQMFVISAAPLLPVAYFVFANYRNLAIRLLAAVFVLVMLYWCYLTGSRLALLLVVVGATAYFQMRLEEIAAVTAIGLVAIAVISNFDTGLEISSDSRILSTTDTRTDIWKDQWEAFVSNPLFGEPIEGGGRLGFGESTWLGAAAGLGILGLLPMLALFAYTLKLTLRLWSSPHLFETSSLRAMVLSVVVVAMAGTFFEAYLFGVLTLPMTLFLATVFMMERVDQLSLPSGPLPA